MSPAGALLCLSLVVVDGDTFDCNSERIRLSNIDAPETMHARCDAERMLGDQATKRLQLLLSGQSLTIRRLKRKDRYGRTLGRVEANGEKVGDVLVENGLARPWRGKREPWCD